MPCIYTVHLFEVIVVLGFFIDYSFMFIVFLSHPLCLLCFKIVFCWNTKSYSPNEWRHSYNKSFEIFRICPRQSSNWPQSSKWWECSSAFSCMSLNCRMVSSSIEVDTSGVRHQQMGHNIIIFDFHFTNRHFMLPPEHHLQQQRQQLRMKKTPTM